MTVPKGPPIATYRIKLHESGEDLGKWLERNNAHIEISCQLGKYHIHVTKNYPGGHAEVRNTSVTRHSTIVIGAHGDMFQDTFSEALNLANKVKP